MSNRDNWQDVYDYPLGYSGPLHHDRVKRTADVKDGPKRRRKTRRDEKNDFSFRNWCRRDYYEHCQYPEGSGYAGMKASRGAPATDPGNDDATDSVWLDARENDVAQRLENLDKFLAYVFQEQHESENYISENF